MESLKPQRHSIGATPTTAAARRPLVVVGDGQDAAGDVVIASVGIERASAAATTLNGSATAGQDNKIVSRAANRSNKVRHIG